MHCTVFTKTVVLFLLMFGLSLLRYDRKDTSKLTLVDIQFLAAMGPPGGGRNIVTPRLLRHFNIITMNEFIDETMMRIFSTIINFYLKVRS